MVSLATESTFRWKLQCMLRTPATVPPNLTWVTVPGTLSKAVAGDVRRSSCRERKGRGKQSGAGRAGEEQRRWAREKKNKKTPKHRARKQRSSKERKKHDAPDWSVRGEWEHGPSPRTGSSGGEPGATDWSVRGNGENTTKRRPGLELPGRNEAQH